MYVQMIYHKRCISEVWWKEMKRERKRAERERIEIKEKRKILINKIGTEREKQIWKHNYVILFIISESWLMLDYVSVSTTF